MADRFEMLAMEAMHHLLSGNSDILAILRAQFDTALISSIDYSGVGVYVSFKIAENAPKLSNGLSFEINDVAAHIDGIQNGVGFTLFIKDGVISMLEGYTFGEELWPKTIDDFEVYYLNKGKRNLPFL